MTFRSLGHTWVVVAIVLAMFSAAACTRGAADSTATEPTVAPVLDARSAALIAQIKDTGFAVEPGADGEPDDFVDLLQFTANGSTPWYFVSVIERPRRGFTANLQQLIDPPGNVITYWNGETTGGTQVATDQSEQEDPQEGGMPEWLTPTFAMKIVSSSLDPLIAPLTLEQQLTEMLHQHPDVLVQVDTDTNKVVLSGSAASPRARSIAESIVTLFSVSVDNQIVVELAPSVRNQILANYPNVTPEIVSNVVILSGSVASVDQRTQLGLFVRSLTDMGVRNEVSIKYED